MRDKDFLKLILSQEEYLKAKRELKRREIEEKEKKEAKIFLFILVVILTFLLYYFD